MPGHVPALISPVAFFTGRQPTLRGDGLVLRPWRPADADAVVRAYADPAIEQWHMATLTRSEVDLWLDERARRWSRRGGVDWAVCDARAVDRVLGRVAIHTFQLHQGTGEISYWALPEARGRRLVPRAVSVLCEWAFVERGMHRLELCHAVENEPSCRVAAHAGFALEGTKRAALRHADGWHDMHLHARLAADPPIGS